MVVAGDAHPSPDYPILQSLEKQKLLPLKTPATVKKKRVLRPAEVTLSQESEDALLTLDFDAYFNDPLTSSHPSSPAKGSNGDLCSGETFDLALITGPTSMTAASSTSERRSTALSKMQDEEDFWQPNPVLDHPTGHDINEGIVQDLTDVERLEQIADQADTSFVSYAPTSPLLGKSHGYKADRILPSIGRGSRQSPVAQRIRGVEDYGPPDDESIDRWRGEVGRAPEYSAYRERMRQRDLSLLITSAHMCNELNHSSREDMLDWTPSRGSHNIQPIENGCRSIFISCSTTFIY
jgi:hypothetical protein